MNKFRSGVALIFVGFIGYIMAGNKTAVFAQSGAPDSKVFVAAGAPNRFQITELHPNGVSKWSVLLDTQTGCAWAYSVHTNTDNSTSYGWDFIPNLNQTFNVQKQEAVLCDTDKALAESLIAKGEN